MERLRWVLEMSLTKTLAHKHQCSVTSIYRKHKVVEAGYTSLQAEVERPGKTPLVAIFGGFPCKRNPKGLGVRDFRLKAAWNASGQDRSEVVQRVLAEVCGALGPVQMHHIRKLADIDRPGRRPREIWERIMAARKRKTLAVSKTCHYGIHAGRYDGPQLG
jgi:hypothetical protein